MSNLQIRKCFATTIWDCSLYSAWSTILQIMVPYIEGLKVMMSELCFCSNAQEALILEKNSLLALAFYNKDDELEEN